MIATAGDALLSDILAEPDNDGLRLVYADWLDDNGQPLRAEFIRVQIALAAVDAEVDSLGECHCAVPDPTGCSRCREGKRRGLWVKREALQRCERELLTPGHFWDWFGSYADGWLRGWPGSPMVQIVQNGCTVGYFDARLDSQYPHWTFTVQRGFLSAVRLPQPNWMRYGPGLVRQQPIGRVELSDRQPYNGRSDGPTYPCWVWFDAAPQNGMSYIGPRLYAYLEGGYRLEHCADFATEKEALDALSNACLAFAKGETP